jgi:acyl dehydratase
MGEEKRYYEDVSLGEEIEKITRTITLDEVRQFMGNMGYLHPRFFDKERGKKEGHGGLVMPGPLSATLLCQLITSRFSFDALKKISVDVKGTVRPDEPITCGGMVINKYREGDENLVECDLYIETPHGERPVKGRAILKLDMRRP